MWIHKLGDEFDVASTLRTVVVVVSLLAGDFTSAAQYRVNYAVLEGQPVSTFVGELLRDGNFTGGPRPTFLVRRRHRPSPLLFSVDRRSGAVRTAVVLDREGLCPPDPDWGDSGVADESRCIVSFEVRAIATLTHTVRVDVEVLDLNDNAPAFPDSQVIIIIIVTISKFMVLSSWQRHCESSPGSFDECRTASGGRRPSDQAKRLKTAEADKALIPKRDKRADQKQVTGMRV